MNKWTITARTYAKRIARDFGVAISDAENGLDILEGHVARIISATRLDEALACQRELLRAEDGDIDPVNHSRARITMHRRHQRDDAKQRRAKARTR